MSGLAGFEPLVGGDAERLAAAIGLPQFDDTDTGTTIAIVAPDFAERDALQAMRCIANAIVWNFWPKMVAESGRRPAMRFAVECDGNQIAVPNPARTAPLAAYAQALQVVRERESGRAQPGDFPTFHVWELKSQRPRTDLGWLALHAVPREDRPSPDEGRDQEGALLSAAAFDGPSRHVALMRRAELVVRYNPGPELTNSAVEWAGVFKASEGADSAFTEAEPPAHDDWRPALVRDSRKKTLVRVARARRSARTRVSPSLPFRSS